MEKFPTPGTSTRSFESQQNILLDSLPYAVWLKDAAGCYVYVNQSFLYFHGFSLEGVLSARDDDLFSPELSADYQSKDQLVVSRGEGLRSVEMSQRGDGHKIAVETTRTPVFDDRGDVVALSGIMRVIDPVSEGQSLTDVWSQTENGARSSGRLGWPVVGILHIDPAANVLSASPAAVNALGYDTTEEMMSALSGPENRFYLNPEDREGIVRAIRETGKAENIETSVQRKDGAVLRALLNFDFVRGDGGTTTSLEGTIQDVTENRKAEMALSLAEEKYRNIFENAIEGIFQMAPDGRIISANPALARIFGYESPEELMTDVSNLDARVYGNEKRRREYERLMESEGLVRDFETQIRCRDGSTRWVSVNSRKVVDSRGSAFYYEGTVESTAERKRLEAQLRNAQRMESIGTLAGGVAHDFNNILTTIMGYCSLITMKAAKGNPVLGYVDQIMEAATRASTLTHSLLSFSRKQVAETKAIDVNETIKSVEKLLRRIIGEDIELRTALSQDKLVVVVEDGQIGQVLMNVASNARDAMPDGGVLTIKTEKVHLSGDVTGGDTESENAFAAIEVLDSGSGMDEITKDQAFDPFFTTKEVGKGTGLGLSVVYGIVKQNKGHVNVTSELGKGTSVTVYFPLAESVPGVESLHEKAEIRGGSETLLVAEDNAQVREIVTTTLRDFGYRVVEAFDGADAIVKFEECDGNVDLLLLDVIMPRANGKEAYLSIRKEKPDIKAIFMSGYTGDVLSRKGISRVGIPVISKPIVIERLLREIREVLDRSPAQLTLFP